MTDTVIVTERGPVLEIKINRPDKRNSLTQEAVDALGEAYDLLETDPFAAGIVHGEGTKAFCAGADFNAPPPDDSRAYPNFTIKLSKPIIAAVEGYAVGAGFVLSQSCDIVVAGKGAQFGYPEARIGITGGGGTLIASRVPTKVAADLLLTGRFYEAERAREAGLVSEVTETGNALTLARELADQIAANHAPSVQLLKTLIDRETQTTTVESAQLLGTLTTNTRDVSRLTSSQGLKSAAS
ncbi:enoyl-CoA hydratase/isomerase family protein [Flaviflexus massiliensis]|uniref:enoyl-CoA hydratase/isomerase family protein n=1 Tax=Flaviflexus massiliensis TaxID=1522309 RepID=UPI0006D546B2|nr:enoyl-CoA hydratase/isomerase family protein [Flaviflexus massiliensis]